MHGHGRHTPGVLTFKATPSSTIEGTWSEGTANTVIVTPAFTFKATVSAVPGVAVVQNTGKLNNNGVLVYTSPQTSTTLFGSIGDTTFYDNGTGVGGIQSDGIQNGTEAGVNGVVVTLYKDVGVIGTFEPGTDTVISSKITANIGGFDGRYLFSGLVAGNYLVVADEQTVPVPPGSANVGLTGFMVASAGTVRAVPLAPAQNYVFADFGFVEKGLLEGTAFWDVNHNGVLEGTDVRRANITVWLDTNNDGDLDPGEPFTLTDSSGNYQFLVAAGSYVVLYDSEDCDWTPPEIKGPLGDQTTPGSYEVTVAAGQEISDLNFGRDNSGKIGDTIFADLTNLGTRDPTDPGIQNVTVLLYTNPDGSATANGDEVFFDSQVTSSTGKYLFVGLPDGNYLVRVDTSAASLPTVFASTSTSEQDGTFDSVNAAVVSGGLPVLDLDFGYPMKPVGFPVSGTVWNDNGVGAGIPANGLIDGTELKLSGVKVTISVDPDGPGGPTLPTVFVFCTGADGFYQLPFVTVGATVVITVDPTTLPNAAFGQTGDPDAMRDNTTTCVMPGAPVVNQNFGYRAVLASIEGTVVRNADGDGLAEAFETPVPLEPVTLNFAGPDGILNSGGDDVFFGPVNTDGSGKYSFTGLLPGLYEITKVNPPGLYSLADHDGGLLDSITLTINPGNPLMLTGVPDNKIEQDFELYASTIGNFVWEDTNGNGIQDGSEPGIAGVVVKLFHCADDVTMAVPVATTTTADGMTLPLGSYKFSDLAPGCYKVQFVTPAGHVATFAQRG